MGNLPACRWCVDAVVYTYWLELGYCVGSRMVGVGLVVEGYAPARWNCVLWISSNNGFFLSGFVLL